MSIDKWMNKEAVVVHIYNGILWTVLVAQLCPTLCEPTNCSPPSFSVHGILQTRILEWISIPFSRRTSKPRDQTLVSCLTGRFFTVWATGKSPTMEFYSAIKRNAFESILMSWMNLEPITQSEVSQKEKHIVWKWKCLPLSHVWLSATPQTITQQDPLSMEFSRQEYWSGFPFAPPGDLPDQG